MYRNFAGKVGQKLASVDYIDSEQRDLDQYGLDYVTLGRARAIYDFDRESYFVFFPKFVCLN